VIDLRSDTVTQPTPAMRAAIASAVVGDEQEREDPTVLELERRAAAFLGQEEAVFLPTATMANQIALRILSRPGDELLAEENSHVFLYEQGGPAVFSGLVMRGLPGHRGKIAPEQIRAAMRDSSSGHMPITRLVSIENTHNSSGGRVWTLEEIDAIAATAHELDLRLHLDGARIVNAATALGVPASEIGRRAETVTLCLSKGLGCPLGALVAGSEELMWDARRAKQLFGGAMRQAGIVAAAGVYALDHHVDRIADDHARARRLDVGPLDLTAQEATTRLADAGVRLSDTVHPTILRAVTHLDITDEDVDRAAELVPQALGAAHVPS
jgi:threonine aldolase